MLRSEDDFRRIPRLRLKIDKDGCAIARTVLKRTAGDHLYFHGVGLLGVYYQRSTKLSALHGRRYWLRKVGAKVRSEMPGDYDGTITFAAESAKDIPRCFFRSAPRGIAARWSLQKRGNDPKTSSKGPGTVKDAPRAGLPAAPRPYGLGVTP